MPLRPTDALTLYPWLLLSHYCFALKQLVVAMRQGKDSSWNFFPYFFHLRIAAQFSGGGCQGLLPCHSFSISFLFSFLFLSLMVVVVRSKSDLVGEDVRVIPYIGAKM